jgi:hypothetical protein
MATFDTSYKFGVNEPHQSGTFKREDLQRFTTPLMTFVMLGVGVSTSLLLCINLPAWRHRWLQRKIFHRYCVGRVVDLTPSPGEKHWYRLYVDYSRAVSVDMAGREMEAPEAAMAESPHGDSEAYRAHAHDVSTAARTQKAQVAATLPSAANAAAAMAAAAAAAATAAAASKSAASEVWGANGAASASVSSQNSAKAAEQEAEDDDDGDDEPQGAPLDLLRAACEPDTALSVTDINFRAKDVRELEAGVYDTAIIVNTLCWESNAVAKRRLAHTWQLLRPSGCLMIVDFGRPRTRLLARFADWVESKRVTSLRLNIDYAEYARATFPDVVWPPLHDKRTVGGFSQTIVLQKKTPLVASSAAASPPTQAPAPQAAAPLPEAKSATKHAA